MDPITLIVAALVAGAASGALDEVKDGAKAGVKAAYAKLRALASKRVAGNQSAEGALAEIEADPETWKAPLAAKLTQLGAANDTDLVAAAKEFMELVDQAGAKAGKYNVTITGSQGVQVGDGNTQFNRF
jgi:roadblock/LC7 domain-containing protein